MYRKIFRIIVIFICCMLAITSCELIDPLMKPHLRGDSRLPDDLSAYRGLLLQHIGVDSLSLAPLSVSPIICKKNNVGIYTYTTTTPSRRYTDIFMYDAKDIIFSDITKEEDMKNFLKDNSFSRIYILLLKQRLKKIKRYNKDVLDNILWI